MDSIFMSYSRADSSFARELYAKLKHRGFQVWFDEENLLPGQLWETEIKRAIENASLVIILLSLNSVSRTGYAQKEIRTALDFMERIPEGKPYLVPLRLDACEIPDRLSHIHCGRLTNEQDFERLVKALYEYMGTPLSPALVPANYVRFQQQFETDPLLIIPGYGASMIRVGIKPQEVQLALGVPDEEPVFDDCWFLTYKKKGVSVRIDKEKDLVTTIFLYRDGVYNYSGYAGHTPEGISTNSTRKQIENVFGRPTVVGGDGIINYWVAYKPQGIGVTYDTLDVNDLSAPVRDLSIGKASN